jgi:hypothetical protein
MQKSELKESTIYAGSCMVSYGSGALSSILCANAGMSNKEIATISTASSYISGYGAFLLAYLHLEKENFRGSDGRVNYKKFLSEKLPTVGTLVVLDATLGMAIRGPSDKYLLDKGIDEISASIASDALADVVVYKLSRLRKNISGGIEALASSYSLRFPGVSLSTPISLHVYPDTSGSNYVPPSRDIIGPWRTRQKVPSYRNKPSKTNNN